MSCIRWIRSEESSEGHLCGVERLLTACYGEIFIAIFSNELCELLRWHRALVSQSVGVDDQFDLLMRCVVLHAAVWNLREHVCYGLIYPWCPMRKEVGITLENFDFFRDFYQLNREFPFGCIGCVPILNDVDVNLGFSTCIVPIDEPCELSRVRPKVRVHGAPRAPWGVRTEFDPGGDADEYYALGLNSSGL